MPDTPPLVAQIDREAAEASLGSFLAAIRGSDDGESLVQAFARHRQAAISEMFERMSEPSEAVWGGLPRALMMAFDMDAKTPRGLLKHLERVGEDVPDWLRNEPEMKAPDHVISKGTRAVMIYRAMLAKMKEEAGG